MTELHSSSLKSLKTFSIHNLWTVEHENVLDLFTSDTDAKLHHAHYYELGVKAALDMNIKTYAVKEVINVLDEVTQKSYEPHVLRIIAEYAAELYTIPQQKPYVNFNTHLRIYKEYNATRIINVSFKLLYTENVCVSRNVSQGIGKSKTTSIMKFNSGESVWHFQVFGPPKTPYVGGEFHVSVYIPRNYPFEPPVYTFENKILHINVDEYGVFSFPDWCPAWTIEQCIQTIIANLITPEFTNNVVTSAQKLYRKNPMLFAQKAREWTCAYATVFTNSLPVVEKRKITQYDEDEINDEDKEDVSSKKQKISSIMREDAIKFW